MSENSLLAVLLRSPWWISFVVVGLITLAAGALLPKEYFVVGALAGFPAAAGAVVGVAAVAPAGVPCVTGSMVCGVSDPHAPLNIAGETHIAIRAKCCLSNVVHERFIWDIPQFSARDCSSAPQCRWQRRLSGLCIDEPRD